MTKYSKCSLTKKLDSVYMPGTRVVFSILYMTGNLRSDVCKGL